MKRRDFLKNSLAVAGLAGLSASGALIQNAMAANVVEGSLSEGNANLELILQLTTDNFKYKGHQVKILRREYRRRGSTSTDRVERWAMVFNGRELKSNEFSRLDTKGCFFSDLLPFSEQCTARNLATELVDGHVLQLFDLQ